MIIKIKAQTKISFDWNKVANTPKGAEMIKKLQSEGNTIYLISALNERHQKFLEKKGGELSIPPSRCFATGSNKQKIETVLRLKIQTHYDNNPKVIEQLPNIGKLF